MLFKVRGIDVKQAYTHSVCSREYTFLGSSNDRGFFSVILVDFSSYFSVFFFVFFFLPFFHSVFSSWLLSFFCISSWLRSFAFLCALDDQKPSTTVNRLQQPLLSFARFFPLSSSLHFVFLPLYCLFFAALLTFFPLLFLSPLRQSTVLRCTLSCFIVALRIFLPFCVLF